MVVNMKKSIIIFLLLLVIINIDTYGQQLHGTGLLFEDITKNPLIKKAEPQKVLYKLKSIVDNSAHLPSVGNQGKQNSCVAWALGYYYKTYQGWQDYGWSITDPNHIFSPSFIYNHINGCKDGGAFFGDALKLLTDNGCATIAEFPYQSDYTLWPSESVYLDAIKYRSDSAYYIQTKNMTGIQQVKQFIANGNVAVLGIGIRGNFDNISKFNNTYCVKDTTGVYRGGHALTIVGYDDNKITSDGTGAFRLVNQWGTSWGDNGFCWMSYQAVMDSTISQRYVFYTTNKIHYSPTIIASTQITNSNRNLLELTFGIGSDNSPKYSKNYFDFVMNRLVGQPAISFPNNNIDFDLSDGIKYIDTTQSNNVFLSTQSSVAGTVNNFSITDLRVLYTTTSNETPTTIPDNNKSVFTNINLKIVKTSNIVNTTVAMLKDWNLVSVPVKLSDMTAGTIFPDINSPVYNYTDKYSTVTTLENGKGYWLRYPTSENVKFQGQIVNSTSIPITAGWNLVGGYEKNVNISQITTTPWGIINSPFYGYTGQYEVPTIMEVGKSYWIRVSDAGVLNIANAVAKQATQTIDQGSIDPKWIKIIVCDNKGNKHSIYGTNETINFDGYALPPLPPNGVFDMRWDSNLSVDKISDGTKNILIHSAEYPITLRVEGGDLNIKDKVGGTVINTVVKNGQSIVISNPAIESFQVYSVEIPIAFKLFQNYPNPFNPTTTIKYSIPQSGLVTLKVYDLLGKEVITLVKEEKTAGIYEAILDGSHLSSGVYFYKVQSGNFIQSKKLILLK